jgi:hypothetical protein
MDEEIPRVAACPGKDVITRRNHENRAAKNWLTRDKPVMVSVIRVKFC